jgi:hypothetical protein
VACGTGWWTPHGARDAAQWWATDLNPETMAVARAKALREFEKITERTQQAGGVKDLGAFQRSPVGKLFANRRGRMRVATLRFDFATEAEAMVDHMELSRIAGATENIVVVPDPDGTYKVAQSLIGLVDDVTEIRNDAFNVWSRTISIVERV